MVHLVHRHAQRIGQVTVGPEGDRVAIPSRRTTSTRSGTPLRYHVTNLVHSLTSVGATRCRRTGFTSVDFPALTRPDGHPEGLLETVQHELDHVVVFIPHAGRQELRHTAAAESLDEVVLRLPRFVHVRFIVRRHRRGALRADSSSVTGSTRTVLPSVD